MDLAGLRDHLYSLATSLNTEDRELLTARLKSLISVFPFSEYEYILMFLEDKGILSFAEYEDLRSNYVSKNGYLGLFELAPRIFGEIWGHQHLIDLDNRFQRADKSIDPEYEGQYDLLVGKARIEVKSCRAINTKVRGPLVSKALAYDSSGSFWLNFQQLKLDTCDFFVFIGVWTDKIVYWVLSNDEMQKNPYLSHQHRGGVEYQIGMTEKNIKDFDKYRVIPNEIVDVITAKSS